MYDANTANRQEWLADSGKIYWTDKLETLCGFLLRLIFVAAFVIFWLKIDTIVAVFLHH